MRIEVGRHALFSTNQWYLFDRFAEAVKGIDPISDTVQPIDDKDALIEAIWRSLEQQ